MAPLLAAVVLALPVTGAVAAIPAPTAEAGADDDGIAARVVAPEQELHATVPRELQPAGEHAFRSSDLAPTDHAHATTEEETRSLSRPGRGSEPIMLELALAPPDALASPGADVDLRESVERVDATAVSPRAAVFSPETWRLVKIGLLIGYFTVLGEVGGDGSDCYAMSPGLTGAVMGFVRQQKCEAQRTSGGLLFQHTWEPFLQLWRDSDGVHASAAAVTLEGALPSGLADTRLALAGPPPPPPTLRMAPEGLPTPRIPVVTLEARVGGISAELLAAPVPPRAAGMPTPAGVGTGGGSASLHALASGQKLDSLGTGPGIRTGHAPIATGTAAGGSSAGVASGAASPAIRAPDVGFAVVAISVALALAAGLYHRFAREAAANHPVRQRVLERVRHQPGLLPSALARENGVALPTMLYHVRVLERSGFVRIRRVGPARLIFPTETGPREREAVAALRAPLARAIYYACGYAPLTVVEAARTFRVAPSSVREQVGKLVGIELLAWERGAGRVRFRRSTRSTRAGDP